VVAVSRDHGASFSQVHQDLPPAPGNWGDRDFIAAGRGNQLYLTWDYGPSYAEVRTRCARAYGNAAIWPGDTLGISPLPGGRISLTWGSATGTARQSAIYASVVTV
jgi:hypothetical protein